MKSSRKIIEEKRERELRSLWPDVPIKRMSIRWVGDFNIYDDIQLKISDDFTGETKFFPVEGLSPYLRGSLIQEYYAKGMTPLKELFGGK